MKKISRVVLVILFFAAAGVLTLQAAYLKDVPVVLRQPNGDVVKVLVTGDEFYRTVHDAEGFTILQHPNGFYVYAIEQAGRVVPSGYRVGTVNPALLGISRNLRPSRDQVAPPGEQMPKGSPANPQEIDSAPKTGTINNIVIFIRFADQAEFSSNISSYDGPFNSSTAGANSMYNYFREVSYNTLSISTSFYPLPVSSMVVSYQDSHVRAYFSPYSASNTIGYQPNERTTREHTLLVNAVNAVSSVVPAGLNIDGDGDGYVDNVCFIIKGGTDAWADLLWPHMWSLYSYYVSINGKRVYTYNFQLETSFGVRVLCHEMFHSLGAPDLYHYSGDGFTPVWYWDIMEYGSGHMGAHMKWDYGTWISSIPTITTSGTYTLNPLTSSTGQCYKIASPYVTGQYFVVEYRRKTGTFESSLPGEGLLVYRINHPAYNGNANGPPDEVYIYRPGGTTSANGSPSSAYYSLASGRTAINDTTNPRSFLADGSNGGLDISQVSTAGSTISFYVTIGGGATLTLTAPNSGESWQALSSHNITWTGSGTITNVALEYSTNGGSNWTTIIASTPNDGTYSWTVPNTQSTTCRVRVSDAADGTPSDTSDANFTISAPAAETVSTPTTPMAGASPPYATLPGKFTTSGSTSSWADAVQYYYDFGDGTNSGWLPVGTTEVAKRFGSAGSYNVRAKARCSVHTATESAFSTALVFNVLDTPADLLILPEVLWAEATGGGTWVTEVQVTDVTGGSQAWACFNMTGGIWRGPFHLWTGGGAGESAKFANILSELQTLDPTFTYYGQVGALEVWTQPGAYDVRVAARTLNGNYSKTFPGLKAEPWNSAATSRPMLIQNMMSNATYRSSAGFFNFTGNSVTVDFQLLDSGGSLIGSTFNRSFAAYDFQNFNPFVQAGVPYPTYSYDNVTLRVVPASGTGAVFGFGAAANNASNDPAAQLVVQDAGTYFNSPNSWMALPEAIWALATGGGTWTTEVQMTDVTGASQVFATFYWGGASRGPFLLWTGGGAHSSAKFSNLLSTLQSLDPSYTYYGKVGAVVFSTQDGSHMIHVASLTKNGNYSKTFPGLTNYAHCTVRIGQVSMIQNLTSNATYRSSIGFFNASGSALTVEFRLYNAAGSLIGSMFSQTINAGGFYSVNPFAAAGIPYPTYSYDNVWLLITPTSGTGILYGFGATANNASNDPAAHIIDIHHYLN